MIVMRMGRRSRIHVKIMLQKQHPKREMSARESHALHAFLVVPDTLFHSANISSLISSLSPRPDSIFRFLVLQKKTDPLPE